MERRRHKKYTTARQLIAAGYIKTFREIFETLPKTVMARDLGMNNTRFNKLLADVDKFILKDIFLMAFFLGLDEQTMLHLILQQYLLDKKDRLP